MTFRLIRLLALGMFAFYLHNIGLPYTSSHFIICMISVIGLSVISHIGGWVERVEYETIAIKQLATVSTQKLVEYSQAADQAAKVSEKPINPIANKDYSI